MKMRRTVLRWQDIEMAELDLVKLVSHFAQSNKAEGKSAKTVSWYSEMLFDFVKFLRSTDRAAVLFEFNTVTVREFIIHEQGRGLSPFTVQSKVRALKAFSSWLFAEGYTPDNLLANVKLPKVPVKIVEPLTAAEIDSLLAAQDPLTHTGSRNMAILVTLLDTGLRCSELCDLRFDDAHVEEGYPAIDAVPLDNAVKLLLKRWGKRADVPRLHAHLCRHTYATNFLTHKCGDVFMLRQILGHNTLEMVNRYVHYTSAHAMTQGHISSPVDQLGIKRLRGYKIDRVLKSNRG